jgi:uncharacterized damage-inducible protein DinB
MAVAKKSQAAPSRAAFLADQLKRAYIAEPWHGQSVKELLNKITAEQASARPVSGGHSIWDLVLHMAAWVEIPLRRMDGEKINEYTYEQDWPTADGKNDAAWKGTVKRLDDAFAAAVKRVEKMSDAELDAKIPGKTYTAEFQLLGILQHTAYHAGQIGLLKRAL